MEQNTFYQVTTKLAQGEDGLFYITSDDVPGLFLAGKDMDALFRDVPKVIKVLFEKNFGLNVRVLRAEKYTKEEPKPYIKTHASESWGAFPLDTVPA